MIIRSLVVFFLSATTCFAAQITLTTDPSTEGCNLNAAVVSMQDGTDREGCVAIGAYGTDDTILIPASIPQIFLEPANSLGNPENAVPIIEKSLAIRGIGGMATISRAEASTDNFRFFELDKTGAPSISVSFENLRFEGAFSGGQGGAIYSDDADVLINNCEFYQNQTSNSSDGGAVYLRLGSLQIYDSKFEENAVNYDVGSFTPGGGALSLFATNVQIEDTLFINNSGNDDASISSLGSAGAIKALGTTGTPTEINVVRSVFEGNDASGVGQGTGGAIMVSGNTALTVLDSTFANNNAGTSAGALGGAIALFSSVRNDILIVNTTFSGNISRQAGAIGVNSATDEEEEGTDNNSLVIINSIISGNEGSVASELAFLNWQVADSLLLVNTLVGDDSENRDDSIRISTSDTAAINAALDGGSVALLMSDEDNVALSSVLQPLESSATANAHFPLVPAGLAEDSGLELYTVFVGGASKTVYPGCRGTQLETIASGDPDPAFRTDQLKTSRPKGTACDLGAVEFDPNADQLCWAINTSNNSVASICL